MLVPQKAGFGIDGQIGRAKAVNLSNIGKDEFTKWTSQLGAVLQCRISMMPESIRTIYVNFLTHRATTRNVSLKLERK